MYAHPDDPETIARVRQIKLDHYYRNKDQYKERAKQNRRECRELARKAKNVPCTDCGLRYPYYVMQFDHLGDKIANINSMVAEGRKKALLIEIAKCEVVCANCHAERTHSRSVITVSSSKDEQQVTTL